MQFREAEVGGLSLEGEVVAQHTEKGEEKRIGE